MSGMAADTRAQENLDHDQSGPKLFAASCVQCHKSARGLAKGRMSFTLSYYLRQHYTSSSASAGTLTAYLQSVDTPPAKAKAGAKKSPAGKAQPKGDGQGRNNERNNERADVETADRHDQRRSARQTAGEDSGAIITAIGLTNAPRSTGAYATISGNSCASNADHTLLRQAPRENRPNPRGDRKEREAK